MGVGRPAARGRRISFTAMKARTKPPTRFPKLGKNGPTVLGRSNSVFSSLPVSSCTGVQIPGRSRRPVYRRACRLLPWKQRDEACMHETQRWRLNPEDIWMIWEFINGGKRGDSRRPLASDVLMILSLFTELTNILKNKRCVSRLGRGRAATRREPTERRSSGNPRISEVSYDFTVPR